MSAGENNVVGYSGANYSASFVANLLSCYQVTYYMYSANKFSKQIVKRIHLHWNLPQTIINNRTQLQNSHAEIAAGKS